MRGAAAQFLAAASEMGSRTVGIRERDGFRFGGEQVFLWGQQGIFKPRQLEVPISIRTTFVSGGGALYPDHHDEDGFGHGFRFHRHECQSSRVGPPRRRVFHPSDTTSGR